MLKIAVIGGGYTGLSTVLHLQRNRISGLQVVLFDAAKRPGRGVAYAPAVPELLLNVPAGRMGALADAPDGFVRWLNEQGLNGGPDDYLPRQRYGDYLEDLWGRALEAAEPDALRVEAAEVTGLRLLPDGVALAWDGQVGHFDRVVLALGNFPPAPLASFPPGLAEHPRYFGNPWTRACLEDLSPEQAVLLLGTSLTMVDTVLALRAQGHRGPLWVLSPRGRLPRAADTLLPPAPVLCLTPGMSLRQLIRAVRRALAPGPVSDATWQALAGALRPHLPSLWAGFSVREQAQFLRHLRHPWGAIRHRLPPATAAELQALVTGGVLQVRAGHLLALQASGDLLQVSYRPRGHTEPRQIDALARVINCTGPQQDYASISTPLLADLRAQGLIQPHPLKLGLLANASGALLDAQGRASTRLFTLGPALRGLWWESTAVGEIRVQAARLATRLQNSL